MKEKRPAEQQSEPRCCVRAAVRSRGPCGFLLCAISSFEPESPVLLAQSRPGQSPRFTVWRHHRGPARPPNSRRRKRNPRGFVGARPPAAGPRRGAGRGPAVSPPSRAPPSVRSRSPTPAASRSTAGPVSRSPHWFGRDRCPDTPCLRRLPQPFPPRTLSHVLPVLSGRPFSLAKPNAQIFYEVPRKRAGEEGFQPAEVGVWGKGRGIADCPRGLRSRSCDTRAVPRPRGWRTGALESSQHQKGE